MYSKNKYDKNTNSIMTNRYGDFILEKVIYGYKLKQNKSKTDCLRE